MYSKNTEMVESKPRSVLHNDNQEVLQGVCVTETTRGLKSRRIYHMTLYRKKFANPSSRDEGVQNWDSNKMEMAATGTESHKLF